MTIYLQGQRHNLRALTVTQVTSYVAKILNEHEIVKWRYAFRQAETGVRFVYTGTQQCLQEGDVVDLRGTIKREMDRYGYIRLCRIRRVQLEQELPL